MYVRSPPRKPQTAPFCCVLRLCLWRLARANSVLGEELAACHVFFAGESNFSVAFVIVTCSVHVHLCFCCVSTCTWGRQKWMFIHVCLCTQLRHGLFACLFVCFEELAAETECLPSCVEHKPHSGNANGCYGWQNTLCLPDVSALMNVFWARRKPTVCLYPL